MPCHNGPLRRSGEDHDGTATAPSESALASVVRIVFVSASDENLQQEIDPQSHQATGTSALEPVAKTVDGVAEKSNWCQRCLSMNWERALSREYRVGIQDCCIIHTFPSSLEISNDPTCPCCCTLAQLAKGTNADDLGSSGEPISLVANYRYQFLPSLIVLPRGNEGVFRHVFSYLDIYDLPGITERFLTLPADEEEIHRRKFDPLLISQWLHTCDTSHRCRVKTSNISGLQLIQCSSRTVIRSIGDEEYAALSYVWGRPSPNDRPDEHGRLRDGTLGLTIEDAITLTLSLGLEYVWIDRYCIPDNDQARQIGLMDKIYGNATITFISAAGEDATYGLPGVSARKQTWPIAALRLSSTRTGILVPQDPSARVNSCGGAIRDSKWNTRGWTFQEAILSSRNLIFTDDMCVWHCQELCIADATPDYVGRDFALGESATAIGDVSALFESYLKKDLTWEGDILNAITGILNSLQETNPTTFRSIQGLPVMLEEPPSKSPYKLATWPPANKWNGGLFHALFWGLRMSETRCERRRPDFPSWSWTGWDRIGGDFYFCMPITYYQYLGTVKVLLHSEWISADEFFELGSAEYPPEREPLEAIEYLELTTEAFTVAIKRGTVGPNVANRWVAVRMAEDGAEQVVFEFVLGADLPLDMLVCKGLIYDWVDPIAVHEEDEYHIVILVRWMEERQCYERLGLVWVVRHRLAELQPKLETVKLG